jgi:uncharacterized membrane protein
MHLKNIPQKLSPIIKVVAVAVITIAIALEIWNIQALTTNTQFPNNLNPVLIFAHIALSAHFLEAIIAAYYAPTKNHQPIKYGIYTFFVGTVSLLELWSSHDH